jgi:hypothetical protein
VVYVLYDQMRITSDQSRSTHLPVDGGEPVRPPRSVEEALAIGNAGRFFIFESQEMNFQFGTNGALSEMRMRYTFRSRVPGVRYFGLAYLYDADRRAGVSEVEKGVGASELTVFETEENGLIRAIFELDEELSPDDPGPHMVTCRIRIHSEARAIPIALISAASNQLHAKFRLHFEASSLPRTIWWVADTDFLMAQSNPRSDRQLPLDPTGYYAKDFDGLIENWIYGFSWHW